MILDDNTQNTLVPVQIDAVSPFKPAYFLINRPVPSSSYTTTPHSKYRIWSHYGARLWLHLCLLWLPEHTHTHTHIGWWCLKNKSIEYTAAITTNAPIVCVLWMNGILYIIMMCFTASPAFTFVRLALCGFQWQCGCVATTRVRWPTARHLITRGLFRRSQPIKHHHHRTITRTYYCVIVHHMCDTNRQTHTRHDNIATMGGRVLRWWLRCYLCGCRCWLLQGFIAKVCVCVLCGMW